VASLDLKNPGPKEYAIVGGGALALFLVYKWWKNRQAAPAAADTTDSGTTAPSTPTGLNTAGWMAWLQDHAGTSTTTSTTTSSSSSGTGTVPNVVGQRGEAASAAIKGAGFKPLQTPSSTAKGKSTTVTSQNPKGGAKAAKGSDVAYAVKVDA
jgi:PASTA domain-containing protein